MRKVVRSVFKPFLMTVGIGFFVAGCSPAVQPISQVAFGTTAVTGSTHQVPESQWQTLVDSATAGEQVQMYKVKMNVDVARGRSHSDFSVYGTVNPPVRSDILFHLNGTNYEVYQQGESAYAAENLHWQQVQSIDNVDVYPEYLRVFQAAQSYRIPLEQYPDTFCVDEYCKVFRAVIPNQLLQTLPALGLGNGTDNGLGNTEYTIFVGNTTHQLREVITKSQASTPESGPMTIQSDTVVYAIDNIAAQVLIPPQLMFELESLKS